MEEEGPGEGARGLLLVVDLSLEGRQALTRDGFSN